MNSHQMEVAQMERRHRLMVRAGCFVTMLVVVMAGLWSAGWFSAERSSRSNEKPAPETMKAPGSEQQAESGADSANKFDARDVESSEPQPLYLLSTSPGRNAGEGTAQIGTNPDNPQTFAGGAVFSNGARLLEIHEDHVVLGRAERKARLNIYRRGKPAPPVSDDLLKLGGEPAAEALLAPAAPPVALTHFIRPSPVYDGAVLRGFEVYAGSRSHLFARLGLRSGDVITALDDTPLNDGVLAEQLFDELMRGRAMVATIERNKSRLRITLDGALIAAESERARDTNAQAYGQTPLPRPT